MSSRGAFIWVDPEVRFNVNGILISQPPTGGTSGSSVTNGGPASAVPSRTNQPTASAHPIFLIRPPLKERQSHAKAKRRKEKTNRGWTSRRARLWRADQPADEVEVQSH